MSRHPTKYLIDNSAFNRAGKPSVAQRLQPLMERGLLHTCPAIEIEAGRGYRATEYDQSVELRRESLVPVHMPDDAWERAVQIQRALAARGLHQGPGMVDILVAVCADHHALTVLHYDADFDAIESVTPIPTEWVVPRGTADEPDTID